MGRKGPGIEQCEGPLTRDNVPVDPIQNMAGHVSQKELVLKNSRIYDDRLSVTVGTAQTVDRGGVIKTASFMQMNKAITLANEKFDGPGQTIFKIPVIIPIKAAVEIHIALTLVDVDGGNICPGNNNQITGVNLGTAQNLPGNKSCILISLNTTLDHDGGSGLFSLNKMNPERILRILEKYKLSMS
jgi:hypothetical protein